MQAACKQPAKHRTREAPAPLAPARKRGSGAPCRDPVFEAAFRLASNSPIHPFEVSRGAAAPLVLAHQCASTLTLVRGAPRVPPSPGSLAERFKTSTYAQPES